jgi:23S rRNA (adenine2503-C2)-methyltransferase
METIEMNNNENLPLSLFGLSPEQITEALGLKKKFQGKQIYEWLVKGALSFDEMTNLPKALREELSAKRPSTASSKVIETQVDDNATKLAIELFDGNVIECVLLSDKNDRKTACLSSQVGCAMGCKFCRTATMGMIRNLSTEEIIEQFVHLTNLSPITHIVYMGMGEPMNNMENVLRSIHYFHDENAYYISLRRITISTCGIIPGINKLAETGLPIKLAISLVSADNPTRSKIMPVNEGYNLDKLRRALLHYQNKGGKRFTLEYCMLSGVNVHEQAAIKLAQFTRSLDAVVNLIPWNPAAELPYETPTTKEINHFCAFLDDFGVSYTRRFTKGRDINGACGQLATKTISDYELYNDVSDDE